MISLDLTTIPAGAGRSFLSSISCEQQFVGHQLEQYYTDVEAFRNNNYKNKAVDPSSNCWDRFAPYSIVVMYNESNNTEEEKTLCSTLIGKPTNSLNANHILQDNTNSYIQLLETLEDNRNFIYHSHRRPSSWEQVFPKSRWRLAVLPGSEYWWLWIVMLLLSKNTPEERFSKPDDYDFIKKSAKELFNYHTQLLQNFQPEVLINYEDIMLNPEIEFSRYLGVIHGVPTKASAWQCDQIRNYHKTSIKQVKDTVDKYLI